MYMAIIYGYTEIFTFSADMEKAKRKAVKKKKELCRDDLQKWNWETVSEYYGAKVFLITDGLVMVDY